MEEVVQTLVEEGALIGEYGSYRLEATLPELHISPTVQGVLAARIDRLTSEEKALLQQLSVIGRQFPISLVKQVVTQPEAELYRVLSSLQAKEFLYEQPTFPESEYLFKHALTQEVAYGTVLQEQRKVLHEQTAQAIETLYAEKLEEHYSELAYHYSYSANTEKAIEYLYLAGQRAVQRSANAEAIHHLTQGLELLPSLPSNVATQQRELQLHLTLGLAFMAAKGYAAPEVERAYTRARELSDQLDDPVQEFSVLRGLVMFYNLRADLQTVQTVSEQMLQLAERETDSPFLAEALWVAGMTCFDRGQIRPASEYFERSLALYDPADATALRYGVDSGVVQWVLLAWVSWMLGYPDRALTHAQAALARAQTLSHPNSSANAISYTAIVHQWRREPCEAQPLIDAVITLAAEQGLPMWEAWTGVPHGWVVGELGDGQKGIEELQKSWELFEANGGLWSRPYYLASLAEVYRKVGQITDGLTALSDALDHVEQTGERWYEAELYRLKGELTLQQSQEVEEAEADFHTAIDIARYQQAKSWELRAATSLARLWQQQGKTTEACDLLTPVYNWFTEGFDTRDLKDAKALLEELT